MKFRIPTMAVLALSAAAAMADPPPGPPPGMRGPGIELVIHAIPQAYAARISVANPPQLREETPLKPIFVVESLEAVRLAAEVTGGSLQPTHRAWQYNGAIVLDGSDPEGNVVQFRQYDT